MEFQHAKCYALQHDCRYDNVRPVLEAAGLLWVQRIEPGELQLHEQIHLSKDRQIAVRYVEDPFVEIAYLQIESDDAAQIVAFGRALGEQLELFDLLDLEALGHADDLVSWSFAVRGMAALVRDHWGAARTAVEKGLLDARRDARRIALRAIARLSWAELVPVLEQAVAREIDDSIRSEMETLIGGLRKHGKTPTGFIDW